MDIVSLEKDIKEYFDRFGRPPLRAALRRRDVWSCISMAFICFYALYYLLREVYGGSILAFLGFLSPIMFFYVICGVRILEVYSQIRSKNAGKEQSFPKKEQQEWMCDHYWCAPNELIFKAREFKQIWEERQELQRLASNDHIGPQFSKVFSFLGSRHFISIVLTLLGMILASSALEGSIDKFFSDIESWENAIKYVFIVVLLIVEFLVLYIMLNGMLKAFIPASLELLNLMPINDYRVYRYLLAMHRASDPVSPPGRNISYFLSFVGIFFLPVTDLLKKIHFYILRLKAWASLRLIKRRVFRSRVDTLEQAAPKASLATTE